MTATPSSSPSALAVATNCRNALRTAGIDIDQAADRIGIDRQRLRGCLNGDRGGDLTLAEVEAIANLADVSALSLVVSGMAVE